MYASVYCRRTVRNTPVSNIDLLGAQRISGSQRTLQGRGSRASARPASKAKPNSISSDPNGGSNRAQSVATTRGFRSRPESRYVASSARGRVPVVLMERHRENGTLSAHLSARWKRSEHGAPQPQCAQHREAEMAMGPNSRRPSTTLHSTCTEFVAWLASSLAVFASRVVERYPTRSRSPFVCRERAGMSIAHFVMILSNDLSVCVAIQDGLRARTAGAESGTSPGLQENRAHGDLAVTTPGRGYAIQRAEEILAASLPSVAVDSRRSLERASVRRTASILDLEHVLSLRFA
ncbi:hypothetical protein OH76DRAFT_216118 [Lentinus brumalis]|uniref:Uncharacterized protein n=1 Tax=Lentinus brumalis TaxID=2498619 RepID=A0A371CMG2_9APHY|nr:hypothetical protein OH76DRAFT_216118 [Polyporus brumalis]